MTHDVQSRVLGSRPVDQTALQSAAADSLVQGSCTALGSWTQTNHLGVSSGSHMANTEHKYLFNIQYLLT